jgi:Zn-dependent protease
MVFNLLPFPPLDGSEIILLFFPPQQAGRVRHTIQQMGLFGLLIAWLVFPMIYGPIRMFFQQFWP